jgi:hypothetical protein
MPTVGACRQVDIGSARANSSRLDRACIVWRPTDRRSACVRTHHHTHCRSLTQTCRRAIVGPFVRVHAGRHLMYILALEDCSSRCEMSDGAQWERSRASSQPASPRGPSSLPRAEKQVLAMSGERAYLDSRTHHQSPIKGGAWDLGAGCVQLWLLRRATHQRNSFHHQCFLRGIAITSRRLSVCSVLRRARQYRLQHGKST